MSNVLSGGLPTSAVHLNALERTYALLSPLVFRSAQLVERMRGASLEEQQARLGYVQPTDAPAIWFHGASAGEMAAAGALSAALREHGHHFEAVYTATNRAGTDYIRRTAPEAKAIGLAPWDTGDCVARALDRWRPRALFIVETELWPRLVFEAYERGILVFCVSARIYPADLARYRAIRRFMGPTLKRITRILAQDDMERDRFIQIGAPAERCLSAGNLKYIASSAPAPNAVSLRAELGLGPDDRVVVCGSIHSDEIAKLFESISPALADDVRLVVAPRHLSAAEAIVRDAARRGWQVERRSAGSPNGQWRVMILDTMGELGHFYSIASCAIVGGGFGRHGGHNPFEAVRGGAAVLFGPNFFHFDSDARALAGVTPEAQVSETAAVGPVLSRWLGDEALRARVQTLQQSVLPDSSAIAAHYTATLEPFLKAAGI